MLTFFDPIPILVQAHATILWGFLDTSIKFISTPSIRTGSLLTKLIFAIKLSRN